MASRAPMDIQSLSELWEVGDEQEASAIVHRFHAVVKESDYELAVTELD